MTVMTMAVKMEVREMNETGDGATDECNGDQWNFLGASWVFFGGLWGRFGAVRSVSGSTAGRTMLQQRFRQHLLHQS